MSQVVSLVASLFWWALSDVAFLAYRVGYKATMLSLKASGWCAFMSNQTFEEGRQDARVKEGPSRGA